MKPQPYPDGIDCAWLASDRDGQVGAFITAGCGPIPAAALDARSLRVTDVEWRLLELPVVTRAVLRVSMETPDDFIALATRGIFVYDWTDIHRSIREEWRKYEQIATPSTPITSKQLPADLHALAETVKLEDVVFAAHDAVDVRTHRACTEATWFNRRS